MANSFDIASFNLINWANSVVDLYDSTPKDVEIIQKDNNGNLFTKDIANRGKFKQELWDDVGSALGQFNRTFYVDAENGDNNNNGDSNHSFKTIKKACDSVPIGGYGEIYLIGSGDSDNPYNYVIGSNISIAQKYINIAPTQTGVEITPTVIANSSYNITLGFTLKNGALIISTRNKLTINNAQKADSNLPFYWHSSGVINVLGNSFIRLGGYPADNRLIIKDGGCHLIHLCLRDSDTSAASIGLQYVNAVFDNTTPDAKLINIYNSAGTFSLATYSVSLTDTNGDTVSWGDSISGIVKDSNGVPRNVVSNIVF